MPSGSVEPDLGLLADREQRLGPDVQAARGQILGLRLDRAGRAVELDPTPADQPLVAAPARVCHFRKYSEPGIVVLFAGASDLGV